MIVIMNLVFSFDSILSDDLTELMAIMTIAIVISGPARCCWQIELLFSFKDRMYEVLVYSFSSSSASCWSVKEGI